MLTENVRKLFNSKKVTLPIIISPECQRDFNSAVTANSDLASVRFRLHNDNVACCCRRSSVVCLSVGHDRRQ